uniref:Putative disease resistance protein RGA1 n=1 Tax=Rhizophora mucronata TaxID=61149 RepID=A0A2P2LUQ5_RHIMU
MKSSNQERWYLCRNVCEVFPSLEMAPRLPATAIVHSLLFAASRYR